MRCILVLILITGLLSVNAQPKPKVILVIADGIPADVIERLRPAAMQQIADSGAYKRAYVGGIAGTYKQTPTISAPGYTDMLTGTWAYKHNVWDNENQQPNYNYPTIFRLFKTAKPQGTTAIFSTWVDNRKVLLGAGLPQTQNMQIDYVFDNFENDSAQFPHDTSSLYLHNIDDHVVHCADSVIRKNAPDLSWIYLEYTDDVGHSKGTGAAFDSAVGLLDRQMRKVNEAIHYRETNFNERWLLLITTDHGRDSITGAEHGDQSERERTTWMIMNKPVTNAYFAANEPGIIDILPSLSNYLNFTLPENAKREIDGVPFIGDISVSNMQIQAKEDSLLVKWASYNANEKLKIFITYTNNAKSGKPDKYELIGSANSSDNSFKCKVDKLLQQAFYKVLVEGKYNDCNAWHTNTQK